MYQDLKATHGILAILALSVVSWSCLWSYVSDLFFKLQLREAPQLLHINYRQQIYQCPKEFFKFQLNLLGFWMNSEISKMKIWEFLIKSKQKIFSDYLVVINNWYFWQYLTGTVNYSHNISFIHLFKGTIL